MMKKTLAASLSIMLFSCATVESLESSEQEMMMAPDAGSGASVPAPVDAGTDAPSDAAGPTKTTTNNTSRSAARLFAESFLSPPSKQSQIDKHGALDATQLDAVPRVGQRTMAAGGTCVTVSNIPDGYLVGSSGADPCIIAVIVNCDGSVIACHFYASDDAAAALAALGPFGECAHAAIAGGNNEPGSNTQLSQVIAALGRQGIAIDGIIDRIGIYWDSANNRWVYSTLEQRSQNRR